MIPAKEFDGELWIRAADIHLLTKDKSHAWVGLTDDEQQELYDTWIQNSDGWGLFYSLIEAKLKDKNQ